MSNFEQWSPLGKCWGAGLGGRCTFWILLQTYFLKNKKKKRKNVREKHNIYFGEASWRRWLVNWALGKMGIYQEWGWDKSCFRRWDGPHWGGWSRWGQVNLRMPPTERQSNGDMGEGMWLEGPCTHLSQCPFPMSHPTWASVIRARLLHSTFPGSLQVQAWILAAPSAAEEGCCSCLLSSKMELKHHSSLVLHSSALRPVGILYLPLL